MILNHAAQGLGVTNLLLKKKNCISSKEEMERICGMLDDAAQGLGLYLKGKKGSAELDSAEDAFAKKRGKNL